MECAMVLFENDGMVAWRASRIANRECHQRNHSTLCQLEEKCPSQRGRLTDFHVIVFSESIDRSNQFTVNVTTANKRTDTTLIIPYYFISPFSSRGCLGDFCCTIVRSGIPDRLSTSLA